MPGFNDDGSLFALNRRWLTGSILMPSSPAWPYQNPSCHIRKGICFSLGISGWGEGGEGRGTCICFYLRMCTHIYKLLSKIENNTPAMQLVCK